MPAPNVVSIAQDEILTGEAVALDVQPVGLMLRTAGAFIDMLVSFALLIAAMALVGQLANMGLMTEDTIKIVLISLLVLTLVIIPAAIETVTGGRSLGKLAIGGRIVRSDGGRITARHAAMRALLGVLEVYMTFGSLAFIVGIFTPRAQRLGDLVAGTYSERTRAIKVPETAIPMPPMLAHWAQTADVGRLPVRLARRLSQFLQKADNLAPGARLRLASELAEEAAPFVSPIPATDPESFIRAVSVLRRDREYRALVNQDARVAAMLGQPASN